MVPLAEVTTPTKFPVGRVVRIALVLVLLVVVAGVIAPYITMASYSGQIREALESALGRKVEFQKLRLTLFSGPGFLLESVTIGEDPRYGLEPFAFVPTLDARLRLDKLLVGRIQFSSLRLVQPSLNLVRNNDGTWNIAALIERLSEPRRAPLNLFPVVEVSGGRLNFKLGMRKTTLYISESDLSIYPERSGKLYFQFSGSPARTDRAGNGFGHFRGSANWYLTPKSSDANKLEAEVTLEPSNLSEMTTLFAGYDMGVHGTVSSHVRIQGPENGLRLDGDLHLEDVHRWDLLPSSGEDWHIRYGGTANLQAHLLDVRTIPWHQNDRMPVMVQVRVDDFLRTNHWMLTTQLTDTPAQNVLPLASRMGLSLPANLKVDGSLNGRISYGELEHLSGEVTLEKLVATVPEAPSLTAGAATITLSDDHLYLGPTMLQTADGTAMEVSGDYVPDTRETAVTLRVNKTPLAMLKSETEAWFGENPTVNILHSGDLTGDFHYRHDETNPASWSGRMQFAGATLNLPELAIPLTHAGGRLTFSNEEVQIDNFSAALANKSVQGSYGYSALAARPERLHLKVSSLDLAHVNELLNHQLGAQDLWSRLHFGRYRVPGWLADRDMDGTLEVSQLLANDLPLGSLRSHFVWKGAGIQVSSFVLRMPKGSAAGQGTIALASGLPVCHFTSRVSGLPYKGGTVEAVGQWQSSGIGTESLRNFQASGTFSAASVTLSQEDDFDKLSGPFRFFFSDGWPNLQLPEVEATKNGQVWTGDAASQRDGTIVFDIHAGDQQRRLVTPFNSQSSAQSALPPGLGDLHQ